MQLKRSISSISLLMTGIGGIVGSGWLFGPFYAAQYAGPAAIVAWVLGGVLMMIIALAFAELASSLPLAGGMVRFTQFSHGPLVSFTIAWMSWLSALIVAPIEAMAILQYTANYVPWLMHHNGTHTLSLAGTGIAACLLFLLCILNTAGVHFVSKTNSFIVFWKIAIPLLIVGFLIGKHFDLRMFSHYGGFAPYGLKGVLMALPAAGIVLSFVGYGTVIQMAGESKNPGKAIPLAIIGSILAAMILYVLLQLAFIGGVQEVSLTHGWKSMAFKEDVGPFVGLLSALGFVWFMKLVYVNAVLSPFGTAYIYTASTARINYAMSQNGYLPSCFKQLNKNGVPFKAILLNFVVGMLFFLPFPGWQSMVTFLVSCFVLSYVFGPIALLALRYKMPNIHRPFRLPFVKFLTPIIFYICNLIIYWTGWVTVWHMLFTMLIGYVFLFVYRRFKKGDLVPLNLKHTYWLAPYFLGMGILSYLGAFKGGLNIIPFGWDFLAVFLFSMIIFYLAVKASELDQLIDKPAELA